MRLNLPLSGRRVAFCAAALAVLFMQGCSLFGNDNDGPPVAPPRGFYTLSFPTLGSSLNLDSTYQLLWAPSAGNEGGTVRISLYQQDVHKVTLAASATNSGSYSLSLPSMRALSGYRVGSGNNYRIRISSTQDTGKWDFGSYFTLYSSYSGTLSLTTPAADAVAKLDSALAIRWLSTGTIGSNIGIHLYKDTVLVSSITSIAPNSGFYQWARVASNLGSGTDYRIRIFSLADPAISSLSPAFRITSTFDGALVLTSPKSGDTVATGTLARIAWTVTGNAGSLASLALYQDSVLIRSIGTATLETGEYASWSVTSGLATGSRYRIRITSQSDAGIADFSDYFTIKGSDPDSYEKDDSLNLAKEISVDGKFQQHTLSLQDVDWLRFNTVKGKNYLVSVRGVTSVSGYAADSAGNILGTSLSGSNFQLVVTQAYAGRHHLRFSTYSGYGPYTVSVTEYDSTQASARIVFSAPDTGTTWATGSTYSIKWTPDSLFYGTTVALALYDDTVRIQTIYSPLSNSGTYSWYLPASLVSSSKYRIRISSYANPQIFSYSPRFTISGLTPDTYEPDNVRNDAKLLPADGVAQTRTVTSADNDWIRIDAKSGKKYLASFNSTATLYASVMDSASRLISNQSGSQFPMTISPTYTGAYYFQVQGSGSYGNYTVVMVEYDSQSGGFPAKFTAPDTGSTWAAGSTYALTWTPDVAIFGTYSTLALYLDSTLVQSINSGLSNTGTYSWFIPSGLATSSRYRIRITNGNNSQLFGYSPFFTISGVSPDPFEPDNQKGAAKDIAVDGVAQNRNLTSNDSDWVKFDGILGKTYMLNLSSTSTVYLYALDSAGNSLGYQSGSRVSLVVKPVKSGKIFARVQVSSGTGPYSLSVLAFDGGPDGIPVKFIAPDSTTTWAAGAAYTVTWVPDTLVFGRYVSLALYQDTVYIQSLVSSLTNSGSYSVSVLASLASGSKYRIRLISGTNTLLYGSSRPFTISGLAPDSLEPNDSAGAARELAPNQPKRSLSLSYKDKDWFKVGAKAQMLYMFQATSATSLPTTLRLHTGLGGTLITTNSKTGTDSLNSIAWICPADGVYSLAVEPYSSSTTYYGSYGLEIKEVDPATYKFTVTSPAADAAVKLGQSLLIQWTDPAGVKGLVDIFLYNTEGVVQTITAGLTNSGTYLWAVPSTLTARGGYYVKVNSRLNGAINGSSGTFTVGP